MRYRKIKPILDKFQKNIRILKKTFLNSNPDFFFTEKELHAYLYQLCLQDDAFKSNNGLSLVHAEYPTPFKCSMANHNFEVKGTDTKFVRGHIDMVLLNPNFITWINARDNLKLKSMSYVTGLGHILFSEYIADMIQIYEKFYTETNEPVLLSAVEFKYVKVSYIGIVTPIRGIIQDLKKLEALNPLPKEYSPKRIPFAKHLLAIMFINQKSNLDEAKILANKEVKKQKDILDVVRYPK